MIRSSSCSPIADLIFLQAKNHICYFMVLVREVRYPLVAITHLLLLEGLHSFPSNAVSISQSYMRTDIVIELISCTVNSW